MSAARKHTIEFKQAAGVTHVKSLFPSHMQAPAFAEILNAWISKEGYSQDFTLGAQKLRRENRRRRRGGDWRGSVPSPTD